MLALIVIALCREYMPPKDFSDWGWRIPFLVSVILLIFSVYIRLKLNETPMFQRMKEEGKGSRAPLTDSFFRYPNNKYVLLALLGATAGQGVVWYTGQFYALFFLIITLKLDYMPAYMLIGLSLIIGTPFFIFFGWLSDRIGRLKIILAGCLIAAVTYFPLFAGLTHYVNPDLEAFAQKNPITRDGRCRDLQVAHLRHRVHQVLQPATGPRTSSPSSACRSRRRCAGRRRQGRPRDRLDQGRAASTPTPGTRRSSIAGYPNLRKDAAAARSLRNPPTQQRQLADDGADPRHHGDLRDHGVRPDRGVPGRAVPDQDPLHLDVAAVPHRQRLVRRHAAAAWRRRSWPPTATSISGCGIRSWWR